MDLDLASVRLWLQGNMRNVVCCIADAVTGSAHMPATSHVIHMWKYAGHDATHGG